MHICREGRLTFVRTFPCLGSVSAIIATAVLLSVGASLALVSIGFGLALLYTVMAATGFVDARRVGDRMLIRRGFKRFDVLAKGSELKRNLRQGPDKTGVIAQLVLASPDQPPVCLIEVNSFTPAGALRSLQAIGDKVARCLDISYIREFTEREERVMAQSGRDVRFIVIVLGLLLVALVGIAALWLA